MSLKPIEISLTENEKAIEQALAAQPNVQVQIPEGFQSDTAWELANLTRVAYRDYEIFNAATPKLNNGDTLIEGNKLHLSAK